MSLPWTKFQDFYLRLGFLKVLVAVLNKERTSAANELIIRRLLTPLFEVAASHSPKLWERVHEKYPRRADSSKTTVAESLIWHGECPSLLFAITKPTAYKILDWARNVGLVGRGNQITERGILLRYLLPQEEVGSFLAGDALAWNPFVLSMRERVFFLYHLCEIDRVTADVIRELGALEEGAILDLRDAGRVVCGRLHGVLDAVEPDVRPFELPAFRIARDLAATMAQEMEMHEYVTARGFSATKLRPRSRALISAARHGQRKQTKNTDHQTVPRLEQLCDLDFVRKQGLGFEHEDEPRRRWRWAPTSQCRLWCQITGDRAVDPSFLWSRFARTARYSLGNGKRGREIAVASEIARSAWEAYRVVRRPVGHTPLESVAIYAMVDAVASGAELEMNRVHGLMLCLKRLSVSSEYAQFAGGNRLDEMFIRLRDGFVETVGHAVEAGVLPFDVESASADRGGQPTPA